MKKCVLGGALGLLLAGPAFAGEAPPRFTKKPIAKRARDGVKIGFAVSAPTDVEVSVLDSKGKVVRHLAAGVLGGKNTPPAPLKKGLNQELEWDLRTDAGKQAEGGPFKVRVRLGLGVKLDGFVGENRHHIAVPVGMATDGRGNLYVYSASTGNKGPRGTPYVQVFDRSCRYLRTLMPVPANLPREKAKAFNIVPVPGTHIYPRNYWGTWPVFYADWPVANEEGDLAARVGDDGVLTFFDWAALSRLAPDATSVGETFRRNIWAKGAKPPRGTFRWKLVRRAFTAVSPDGRYACAAGLRDRKPGGKFPGGRVYRIALSGGHLEKFADIEGSRAVAGLAFDRDGNLLVCDRSGGRVVALDGGGKRIGEFKVDSPERVACHRRTGAVYVMSLKKTGYFRAKKSLIKFSGWKDAKEQARMDLRNEGYFAPMALDDSGERPVVWVSVDRSRGGSPYNPGKHAVLLRLEDEGGKFVETNHGTSYVGDPMGVITRLAVHPETDLVVCRGEYSEAAGYEGLTGKRVKLPFSHAPDMGVGLDGNWYVMTGNHWMGPIRRFDGDMNPIPVPTRSAGEKGSPPDAVGFAFGRYGNGFGVGGIAADHRGRVYSMQQINQHTVAGDCVVVFGPDGRAEDHGRLRGDPRITEKHKRFPSAIFGPIDACVGNVHVDWKGYMYLGLRASPSDHKPPAGFENDPAYYWSVGSVVKVKPEGGSLFWLGGPDSRPPRKARPIPAGMTGLKMKRERSYPRGPLFCEGAVRIYPGLACMSGGIKPGCRCRQPMFHLDGWGRLFIPNALSYSVNVVDNEGNDILRFGRYGNADSRGSGEESPVRTPEIPLGWPEAVGASYKAVYVADVLNRRIVRLLKTYLAEETCAIR